MNDIDKDRASAELEHLSEQIGTIFFNWGFKRMHGKIWTYLLLAKTPLDAPSLVKLLDISKALVSISLRELLEIEAIKIAGKSDRGTQVYIANSDVKAIVATVLRRREQRLLGSIKAAQSEMTKVSEAEREQMGICDQKLAELGQFISKATVVLDRFIKEPTVFDD